ncbi:MAG: gephyrin-like molybdotransferase Glp [bacterium]
MDLTEALAQLFRTLRPVQETETVALADAVGRVVAEPIFAPIDLPPFRASAMDGYALAREDLLAQPQGQFRVVGESLAGHPFTGDTGSMECVRIFTGAQVPDGCDQVVVQEQAQASNNSVCFTGTLPKESYIRDVGHDIAANTSLARRGQQLNAFDTGHLAAAGITDITVYRRVRVGVFSTGDELVEPGTAPARLKAGQIYDSNRFTVVSLLTRAPCEVTNFGALADTAEAVQTALRQASRACDVLITSGGVSVGDADFVTSAIAAMGSLTFWRLNLKPGKPLAFGQIDNCYLFGLPGNPVSTIVTLLMVALPAITFLAGHPPAPPLAVNATLTDTIRHAPGRMEFQRGIAVAGTTGLEVSVTGDQSSNRLSTFQGANCFIEVPKDSGDLAIGSTVRVLPFTGLLG